MIGPSATPAVQSANLYLVKISPLLPLPRCKGKRTFARSKRLFSGLLDPDFVTYGTNKPGKPTPEANAVVHEMRNNGNFQTLFGSLSEDTDVLAFGSQDQAITFVESYPQWLHPFEYSTFLLFKVGKKFFVADVYRVAGRLKADVRPFECDFVWRAVRRHRVVIPQLVA